MKICYKKSLLALAVISATGCISSALADDIATAITSGKAYGDFNLRYEGVEDDSPAKDADALTLRSRLGYNTGSYSNLSATLEFEDSRVVAGVDDYSVPQTGFKTGEYSVIADPETTELDQAYLQYKTDTFVAKAGRQVYTLDGHRFVGHVGWRQDRQTFDALTLDFMPVKGLSMKYAYLDKRNRIFAEDQDVDSSDNLFNISYETPIGKLVGYAYLLEDEDANTDLDTYGASLTGSFALSDSAKALYAVEYATQETGGSATDYDADYMLLEGGVVVSGITAKLGYELLGSDDSMYGFQTPLATLHKFNGWADQFLSTPAQGLIDTYLSVGGSVFGGAWSIVYHDFEADEDTSTVDDLGDEIDISYGKKFGKHYSAGIKYASYDAGDIKVDTDKLWVWLGFTF